MKLIKFLIVLILTALTACTTTGQLKYMNAAGEEKIACDVEFVGLPSVDKYAVEYALSYCAKKLVEKGHSINETHLLTLDTSFPQAPDGQVWTHDLAKKAYKNKLISDKEYGYIVAYIDLGLSPDVATE